MIRRARSLAFDRLEEQSGVSPGGIAVALALRRARLCALVAEAHAEQVAPAQLVLAPGLRQPMLDLHEVVLAGVVPHGDAPLTIGAEMALVTQQRLAHLLFVGP